MNLARNVLIGAVAGATATWLMDLVTQKMYDTEPGDVRRREDAARGGKTAYEIAAEKALRAIGADAGEARRKTLGSAMHWGLGISAGAIYGALRGKTPFRYGSGVVFGLAFWLLMDEIALTLSGITPPPQRFPWQTHARGLIGHLVLGAGTEVPFDAIDLARTH